jgi:hydroxymethylglutaryl-CoA lyase
MPSVILTDVTLREHGQNVPVEGLATFTPRARADLAHALRDAGFARLELMSCVNPKVAPAMARGQLEELLALLGPMDSVEIVTLVPNLHGYEVFAEMGLVTAGHTVGVFHSAMDEHNVANLGKTVAQTVTQLEEIARRADEEGARLCSYVSAAFGFAHEGRIVEVAPTTLADQIRHLFDMGSVQVTLSDLQGIADRDQTSRVWDRVLNLDGGAFADRLGYHPHHAVPAAAVDLIEAAHRAGVRRFDSSLGAAGGCVTGAPGNAPTEGVVERFAEMGVDPGVDAATVRKLALDWRKEKDGKGEGA